MKKIGLVLLMAVLFVLALAISISAAEIPEWTDVTELEGMADKATFGNDGKAGATSRVLMDDGKTYPAYYICGDSATLSITFTDISKAAGKTYKAENVVRLEVPHGITTTVDETLRTSKGYKNLVSVVLPEGLTNIAQFFFKDANGTDSKLTSVSIPSTVKTVGKHAFYKCNSLTELVFPEGVEYIGYEAAREATNLKRVVFPSTLKEIDELAFRNTNLSDGIILPEGLEKVGAYAFKASGVTSAVIPSTLKEAGVEMFRECASLKTVVCKSTAVYSYMFYACNALESVTLENTVEIKDHSFYIGGGSTGSIKSIELPNTLTSIEKYAFIRQGLESIVVPQSVGTVGQGAFQANKSMTKAVVLGSAIGLEMFRDCSALRELVITERVNTEANSYLTSCASSFVTYYTGSDYDRIKGLTNNDNERITKAVTCDYEDYLSGNYTSNKYMFVCNANLCDVVYGAHLEDNNLCVINCTRCGISGRAEENPVHVEGVNIVYVGYDKDGKRITYCKNQGCEHRVEEDVASLFRCLGLSASTYGDCGVVLGYVVNKEAIDEYTSVTGRCVEYGVFAGTLEKVGNSEIIDREGKILDGIICADVSADMLGAFELKVIGFSTEVQKDAWLALGAYVITRTEESYEVSYMQAGKAQAGEKYFFTSYNEIIK